MKILILGGFMYLFLILFVFNTYSQASNSQALPEVLGAEIISLESKINDTNLEILIGCPEHSTISEFYSDRYIKVYESLPLKQDKLTFQKAKGKCEEMHVFILSKKYPVDDSFSTELFDKVCSTPFSLGELSFACGNFKLNLRIKEKTQVPSPYVGDKDLMPR